MTYNPISKKRKDEDEFDDGETREFGFHHAPRFFADEDFERYVNSVNERKRKMVNDLSQKEKKDIENALMTLENLAYDRKNDKDGKVSPKFKEKMYFIENIFQRQNQSMQDKFRDIRRSASQPTSDWWDTIKGKKKRKSTVNEAGNYTKPKMRKRQFQRIKAGSKGGPAGKWSARKAQMLAQAYKRAGGGYRD